ncbi:MAG: 4-(cytidine 5'-diphospho)-2-C-methyl-D-erythritol kinase [Austwickia sp.]|nr:MAG: 4-(cytidine 5'-diphospho)-2-C-methyl-D-erythritol kinase [Austwickia sp.]
MTGAPPASLTVRVPAKINLELVVGPLRADGYHDLATIFHAVSLYDELTVTPSPDWAVTVEGPYADLVPVDQGNLVLRAARIYAEQVGVDEDEPHCHFHIDKEIPVAGGMAGGSADAAAALLAMDTFFGMNGDRDTIEFLASELGSDVNFALVGGTAIGSGRGEQVAPVLGRGKYHWVLVPSDEGLSTPRVFAELDRLRAERGDTDVAAPQPTPAMMQALRSGDVDALGAALHNDLQEAAFSLQPRLRDVLAAGLEYGAKGGIVSGSGPTVAFLVDGPEGQLDLAVALTASGVAGDVKRATGPVHGAHFVTTPRGR